MLSFLKRLLGRRGGTRPSHAQRTPTAPTRSTVANRGISPELLKQVRLIELKTRGLVNTLFTGEYRSVFKGQGMEFAEVREYVSGDEVRSIDWNVTARMQRPFVKRYIEERELTVMLVLDVSGSERFGTVHRFKSELVTEFASLIAMSAVRNNDRVGVMFFTDRVEHVVPPRKGKRHVLRIVRDLLAYEPEGTRTNLVPALQHLQRTLHHHAVIFLVSDFVADDYDAALRVLTQRHDVIAVTVNDPGERLLPSIGVARLTDPETGKQLEIDTSSQSVRTAYAKRVADDLAVRRRVLRRSGVDEIALSTDGGVVEPLIKFFRTRETRLRRQ
jgi:uncharacterized protein (DUF58 family)